MSIAPPPTNNHHTPPPPPRARLIPTPLTDPFDALFACDGNEALAAETLGLTLAEFYRQLERADPERVARGIAVRLTVSMNQLMHAIQGRLIDRLNDNEAPISDANLVALLTRGIPALTELARASGTPQDPNNPTQRAIPPEIAQILAKIQRSVDAADPDLRHLPTAGEIYESGQ